MFSQFAFCGINIAGWIDEWECIPNQGLEISYVLAEGKSKGHISQSETEISSHAPLAFPTKINFLRARLALEPRWAKALYQRHHGFERSGQRVDSERVEGVANPLIRGLDVNDGIAVGGAHH